VLTPSWPNPTTSHRPMLPPAVRRRVRRAERRALRRAVLIGATVMAALILSDLATNEPEAFAKIVAAAQQALADAEPGTAATA